MAQFTIYSSSDASAPVLNGTTGSLIAVLDAILVDGYGAKAAAGWTKAFAETSQAAYTMGAGTGFSLSVDDAGPGAGTFKEARIRGFEVPTSATGGSGQFPSTTQAIAAGGYLVSRKSVTADATARDWICYADNRTIYFFNICGDAAGIYTSFQFGDFYSLSGTDVWNCSIAGRNVENSASFQASGLDFQSPPSTALSSPQGSAQSFFSARVFGGTGSSVALSKNGDVGKMYSGAWSNAAYGTFGNSGIQTPNSADNAYYVSPIWIFEASSGGARGRMRGLWHLVHSAAGFGDGQTISGVNDFAGKTFKVVKWIGQPPSYGGCHLLETSDTLETN